MQVPLIFSWKFLIFLAVSLTKFEVNCRSECGVEPVCGSGVWNKINHVSVDVELILHCSHYIFAPPSPEDVGQLNCAQQRYIKRMNTGGPNIGMPQRRMDLHELHPYRLPLPSPERCGPAHFAQQREIRERSEGRTNRGTSGLKWYVANSFRPFLPTDHLYPAQTLPSGAGSTTRVPHQWGRFQYCGFNQPDHNSGWQFGFDDTTTTSMPWTQRQCLEHNGNTLSTIQTPQTLCKHPEHSANASNTMPMPMPLHWTQHLSSTHCRLIPMPTHQPWGYKLSWGYLSTVILDSAGVTARMGKRSQSIWHCKDNGKQLKLPMLNAAHRWHSGDVSHPFRTYCSLCVSPSQSFSLSLRHIRHSLMHVFFFTEYTTTLAHILVNEIGQLILWVIPFYWVLFYLWATTGSKGNRDCEPKNKFVRMLRW